jgi:signal-transduction protein with cAMP-binding, CBS, and nucleotidyltransferase domain
MLTVALLLALWILLAIFALGVAQGSVKLNSEHLGLFDRPAKRTRKVDFKSPTQTTKPSQSIAKSSENVAATTEQLSGTTYVRSVMHRQPYICFENQSVDTVRKTMHELELRYLVVLDQKKHVVGMVTMRDLDEDEKQSPFA